MQEFAIFGCTLKHYDMSFDPFNVKDIWNVFTQLNSERRGSLQSKVKQVVLQHLDESDFTIFVDDRLVRVITLTNDFDQMAVGKQIAQELGGYLAITMREDGNVVTISLVEMANADAAFEGGVFDDAYKIVLAITEQGEDWIEANWARPEWREIFLNNINQNIVQKAARKSGGHDFLLKYANAFFEVQNRSLQEFRQQVGNFILDKLERLDKQEVELNDLTEILYQIEQGENVLDYAGHVYIDTNDPDKAQRIYEAFKSFVRELGVTVAHTGAPKLGSWYANFWIKIKGGVNSIFSEERVDRAEHALNIHSIDLPQSQVDKNLAEAAAVLLKESKDEFWFAFGDLVLVKYKLPNGGTTVKMIAMTREQMVYLSKHPEIHNKSVATLFTSLGLSVVSETPELSDNKS